MYAGSRCGKYIHTKRKVIKIGAKYRSGYVLCTIRAEGENKRIYYVHIPVVLEIDHINDNRFDNRLCNLQLVTPSENKKKAAKNTDYSFTKYNYINKKSIKAIILMTDEVHYFPSMYSVQVDL